MNSKTDWKVFDVKANTGDETLLLARGAYVIQLYGDPTFADNAHELLGEWLEATGGAEGLEFLSATSTTPARLTAQALKRVQTTLQSGKGENRYFWINSAAGFNAGERSIEFNLYPKSDDRSSCVQIRMPPAVVENEAPAKLIADFKRMATRPGVWHASAGLGLYVVFGADWEQIAGPKLLALSKRFLALDLPNRQTEAYLLKGTKGPGWLTYVGAELAGELAAPPAKEPGFSVEALGEGKLIIAGQQPPLGDVNRGAKDIGPLRIAAAMVQPLRTTEWMDIPLPLEMFDVETSSWLARLDPS
jgi:TseV toxin immunity protein TsiV